LGKKSTLILPRNLGPSLRQNRGRNLGPRTFEKVALMGILTFKQFEKKISNQPNCFDEIMQDKTSNSLQQNCTKISASPSIKIDIIQLAITNCWHVLRLITLGVNRN
jgi:hypothetical protein